MSKFAVIKTGGKQYLVNEDKQVKIEKIKGEVGEAVDFKDVLLIADDEGQAMDLGKPLTGKVVKGVITEQGRDKKITVIKYKPKVRYRRKQGHRQPFTKVKIQTIT